MLSAPQPLTARGQPHLVVVEPLLCPRNHCAAQKVGSDFSVRCGVEAEKVVQVYVGQSLSGDKYEVGTYHVYQGPTPEPVGEEYFVRW